MKAFEASIVQQEILDLLLTELLRDSPNKDLQGSLLNLCRYNAEGCCIDSRHRSSGLNRPKLLIVFGPSDPEIHSIEAYAI